MVSEQKCHGRAEDVAQLARYEHENLSLIPRAHI